MPTFLPGAGLHPTNQEPIKLMFQNPLNISFFYLQEGEEESPQPTINGSNAMLAQVDECGGVPGILSRTPSSRPMSRSRHSSFRTNSLDPIASPTQGPVSSGLTSSRFSLPGKAIYIRLIDIR